MPPKLESSLDIANRAWHSNCSFSACSKMLISRLSHPPRTIFRESGRTAPILLIFVALLISALVFFFITKPQLEKANRQDEVKLKLPESTPPPALGVSSAPKSTMPATPPAEATPAPTPAPPTFGFARPLDLGKEMARSLAAGDFARAGSLLAANDPSQAANAASTLEKIIKNLGAMIGPEDKVEILGVVENKTRLALPLSLPGNSRPLRLQIDVERDERMGWKVSKIELPKELASALPTSPSMTASTPGAVSSMPAASAKAPLFTISAGDDALAFGSDFVRALLRHDFAEARKFVDESKVPAERLAGLCIVFEEGQYEFKPTKPLIITVANPEVSWVIAQIQSPALQQSTEFGLELQRAGTDRPWRVVGLNLSEILGSFAASSAKLGVPYTPIVKNPSGGESLALYFEYDQAQLHARAQKQLEIVAGLLKSDPGKKLHIAGHTDAKGTDDYNLRLSSMRAITVKQQLTALGVSEAQIITKGLGKAQPLSPNQKADGTDDPEGRSKNRRAEIYLDF
jgi:outer membrane protein OmpA-like peptidoglycan-associated protein